MANVITTVLKLDAANLKTGLKSTQQQIKETDGLVSKAKVGWSSLFTSFASSPVAIAGATAAVGTFAAASVNAASDLNESINAVNVTFGESADKILAFGENAAKSVGLANSEFNQLATPLGSILKNAGFSLDDTADKTILLTQRAADMASVFNTDVSDALGAIQAGLRGEQDPLERFGVGLSAAKVEARALADTGKANVKQLTEEEKALARVELILDQTNQTAGDFANTSEGLANQTRILKAEFKDLQAEAGQQLIPVLSTLAGALLDAADAAEFLNGKLDDLPGDISIGGISRGQLGSLGIFVRAAKEVKDRFDDGGDSVETFVGQVDRMADSVNAATPDLGALSAEAKAAADAAAEAAEHAASLGDKAANSGPKIGDMAGALDDAREHLADLNEEARDNALGILAEAAGAVGEALDTAFGQFDEDLGTLDALDDITDQFDAIAEAQKDATDPAGIRKYNGEVRRGQRELADFVRELDGIEPEKKIEFLARIRTGDIDTMKAVLAEATKDQFVNIIPIVAHDAFHSVNASFTPGSAPSAPTFSGVTPAPNAPVSTDARTIINYYPVGTTPTTQYIDRTIDDRRNGAR